MKNFSKFAAIALILFFCLAIGQAASAYELEIKLPGAPTDISDPGAYVKYLFIFGLSLAGFLAVVTIAWGGVQYMAAGTSLTSVEQGKSLIKGALGGIILLLCSYLILYTIDPTLVNLSPRILPAGDVSEPDATRNCNPPCATGFFCRASDYTCQSIPTNASQENRDCLTPGRCTEINCVPAGDCNRYRPARLPRLVWNPNTCVCAQP